MNPLPLVIALLSLVVPASAGGSGPEPRSAASTSNATSTNATSTNATSTNATSTNATSTTVTAHGVWPLRPRPAVVRAFDPPSNPYGSGHRGVDLLGAPGEAVRAALPGTVTYAGPLAGIGVVVVDHGATRTTYQPVTASVGVGASVGAGSVIGTLVPSGSHCPPASCLHWGWIRNPGPAGPQVYLDPLALVGLVPMRLLPLSGGG